MATKKHLFPQVDHFYKANLHTHSTISDGTLSPTQVKDTYKELGYQILAITDHNITVDHSSMTEPDFLMLTGVEINVNHPNNRPGFDGKSCHLNLIAKRPDNLWSPAKAYHNFPAGLEYEEKMQFEEMDLQHNPESINTMIAKANEMGFLVMYNHPTWSCHSYPDYASLTGLWGMELRNSECCLLGNNENNARVFSDLLNLGNKLYPVGTDDMHRLKAAGLSWIMVGAPRLCYDSVITALEKGDFYMSCGPEIHSLEIEGNTLKITCSDARHIALESHGRFARYVSAEGDQWVRQAEFDLDKFFAKADDENMYVRLTVTAPDGSYAATRPYYLRDLL